MRGKIISGGYVKENGHTQIKKATPYGTFFAETRAHKDDMDIANAWDGFRFAEMKCDIQALREKAKWMRQRAIGAEIALKNLDNAGVNDPATLDNLERQVWALKREADRCKEDYEEIRGSYQAYTDRVLSRRRELREKVKRNNEKLL